MCKWTWHRGTPAPHSTGTFTGHLRVPGRRLWPVCGRRRVGGEVLRLSVPTWIRETEWRKKIRINYCSGGLKAVRVTLVPNEVLPSASCNTTVSLMLNNGWSTSEMRTKKRSEEKTMCTPSEQRDWCFVLWLMLMLFSKWCMEIKLAPAN